MFETRRRPHPLHTFRFWFAVLAAVAVTVAWKFDLLPFKIGPADTGRLAQEEFTEIQQFADVAPSQTDNSAVDLPFTDTADLADLPALTHSLPPRQTAAIERLPTPLTQHKPQILADDARFADDDWATDAGNAIVEARHAEAHQTEAHPLVTSGIVQMAATTTSLESTSLESNTDSRVVTADQAIDFPSPMLKPTDTTSRVDLTEIDRLLGTHLVADEIEAQRLLSTIYWQQTAERAALRSRIDTLAQQIYFQNSRHYMNAYLVQPGDLLQNIARQYDITWQYLAKLNRVDPKKIRAGQRLKVIKGPFSAIIDLSDFELTIHAHGYYVTRYPVGIGKDGSSPIGTFAVQEKLIDPTYYGPNGVIAHDDPTNPLGERWIDIGDSYGIHGTINPTSIGKSESQGCIRLHNDDAAAVYDLLGIGSEVTIRP